MPYEQPHAPSPLPPEPPPRRSPGKKEPPRVIELDIDGGDRENRRPFHDTPHDDDEETPPRVVEIQM